MSSGTFAARNTVVLPTGTHVTIYKSTSSRCYQKRFFTKQTCYKIRHVTKRDVQLYSRFHQNWAGLAVLQKVPEFRDFWFQRVIMKCGDHEFIPRTVYSIKLKMGPKLFKSSLFELFFSLNCDFFSH